MASGRRGTKEAGSSNQSGDYSITKVQAMESRPHHYDNNALIYGKLFGVSQTMNEGL